MQMPQIQIHQTNVKMDWTITEPFQSIEQPRAVQSIEQPAAILEINTTNAKLDINMDQFWRDLGMVPTGEVIQKHAQQGIQGALEGISRRVSEGRQLMKGSGKGQEGATIQAIAAQNHGPQRPGPYNIKFIPSIGSVKVNITPGTTDIEFHRQFPKIDVQVNKPRMDFTYGDVRGKMIVRPDIQIDVRG